MCLRITLLGRITVGIAIFVRPSGLVRNVIGRELRGIGGKNGLYPAANRGVQVVVCYQTNHFVPLISPCECRTMDAAEAQHPSAAAKRQHHP
jgi:hypothetical protein